MAEFKYYNHELKISSNYAPYFVTGKITEDDVEMLNNSGNQKILIMLNTAGQDSKIISKISKNKAIFSILGGLVKFVLPGMILKKVYMSIKP